MSDTGVILKLYAETVANLVGLYAELAETRSAEITIRAEAYQQSAANSPSGRETDARHAAALQASEAVLLEGQIKACELQLRHLDRLLSVNVQR